MMQLELSQRENLAGILHVENMSCWSILRNLLHTDFRLESIKFTRGHAFILDSTYLRSVWSENVVQEIRYA